MSAFNLTADQQAAYESYTAFLMSETENIWVLQGYAGTGKSTLVQKLLNDTPNILKTKRLLTQKKHDWEIALTATTHKACEALQSILNREVQTIQSLLGLRVHKDYQTRETKLVMSKDASPISNTIVFIDEASYIDSTLLSWIQFQLLDCKIVFIGDPAQLTPVKSARTPVFAAGFPTSRLNEVVRQADGCQIKDLATRFRETVTGNGFFSFKPDEQAVTHLSNEDFSAAIIAEFDRPDWKHNDSKVLAWTNKAVIGYNNAIRDALHGEPELQVDDYAVVNSYLQVGRFSLKTDQQVRITRKREDVRYGIAGWEFQLDHRFNVFAPKCWSETKKYITKLRHEKKYSIVNTIDNEWADLRAAYACTINKSQGSTYDKVFIDLDDIKKCNSGNQIARMMYVAVSRARHHVYLKGDLV